MKKTNLWRSLFACLLTLSMFMGTCATSFAGYILTDEEIAYVEGIVDETKAEIQEIIDVATEGTIEEVEAKIDEYVGYVTEALVVVGYDEAKINDIVAKVDAEVRAIVALVESPSQDAIEDKVDAYIDYFKGLFELSPEEDAKVDEIIGEVKDEIEEIVGIVEAEDEVAAQEKINAYIAFVKDALEIDAEDEAKIAEVVAKIVALTDEIKNIPVDEVKAVVDEYVAEIKAELQLEAAKLGHQYYKANENSKYVAIGGNALAALGRDDLAYFDFVGEELEIADVTYVAEELYPADVLAFVKENEAEIKTADLITYQLDASSFIWATIESAPEWDKYFDAETQAVISEVWAQAKEIVNADWVAEATPEIVDFEAKVKAAVLDKLPETTQIEAAHIDAVIDFCNEYIQRVLNLVETKKDEVVSKVEEITSNEMIIDYAEKLAYAVVAFAVDSKNVIEAIQEINPDAALVVVGMYNPVKGFKVVVEGTTIDLAEYFQYAVEATNIYYYTLAAVNGDFAFVDVADADTNGFDVALDVTDLEIGALTSALRGNGMYANAAGNEYIKDQILKAFVCDYSVYEQFDADYHYVKCAMCGDAYKEAHTFVDNVCSLCGYEVVVEPAPTTRPSYGGGGSVSSQFTIKFDTDGGSKIANVTVKKGELLAEPAAPTKSGFTFEGWYTEKTFVNKYDFSNPVTKSFTLYAKWAVESKVAKFTDVSKDAWYYEYVKAVVEKGLMNGISDTLFAPEATLTRGMFVTILHRVEGEPAVENAVNFTDVAADQYYANAVKWANANGIVKGVTETEFAPDAEVTREQMAAMLARYVEYKKIEVPAEGDVTYTDSDQISEYAADAVVAANRLGILIGNTDGSFAPKKNASRAEAAALFARLLGVLAK